MSKKRRNVIIAIAAIAVLLLYVLVMVLSPSLTPSATTEGYTFVEGIPQRQLYNESAFSTKVFSLRDGEWVIVSGQYGILLPQGKIVGNGNKCYVVGIKGPTNETYTIITLLYDHVQASDDDWSWTGPFDEDFLEEQNYLLRGDDCSGGLNVFTLPVR